MYLGFLLKTVRKFSNDRFQAKPLFEASIQCIEGVFYLYLKLNNVGVFMKTNTIVL